jgi:hypothetical protein
MAVLLSMRACESRPGGSSTATVPPREDPQAAVAQAAAHVSSFQIERRERGTSNDEG